MNNEPQIIISLKEYEELKTLKKGFDEKKIVLHHSSYLQGPSGYPKNCYSIINATEIIRALNNDLEDKEKTINLIFQEKGKLEMELDKIKNTTYYKLFN